MQQVEIVNMEFLGQKVLLWQNDSTKREGPMVQRPVVPFVFMAY